MFSKRNIYYFILSFTLCVIFFLYGNFDHVVLGPALVSLIMVVKTIWVRFDNLFAVNWLVATYTFFWAPLLIFYLMGINLYREVLFIVMLCSVVAIFLTYGCDFFKFASCSNTIFGDRVNSRLFWGFIVVCGFVSVFFGRFAFLIIFPLVLFVFYCRLSKLVIRDGFLNLLIVISLLAFYSLFSWSGSGRLMLASWGLTAGLLFCYRYRITVNKFLFSSFFSLAGILSSLMRFNVSSLPDLMRASLQDSATAPLRYLQDISEKWIFNSPSPDFVGLANQYLLLFLGSVPRVLWENKPFGFGYEYTVRELSQDLVDADHSIAALFVGEHIYFVGPLYGLFSALIATVLVALSYRVLYRLGGHVMKGAYAIPFALWISSFYWAGMATFSQRFQQSFLLILIFLLVSILFSSGKIKLLR